MNPVVIKILNQIAADGKTRWEGCGDNTGHLLCAVVAKIERLEQALSNTQDRFAKSAKENDHRRQI